SIGYLDYINITVERNLIAAEKQLIFSNKETANQSGIGEYQLQNTQNISEVWDITNPYQISRIENNQQNNLNFKANLGEIKKFIAISDLDFYSPIKPKNTKVDNINLKGSVFRNSNGEFQDVDYIIVTPKEFANQASRIAQLRKDKDDLNTKVVLDEDIYTEFSSGKQDISAIRNFVKYVYDNASSPDKRLKYLLLLGNASIDYKDRLPGNNNIIPTFESLDSYSLRHVSTG